MKLYPLSLAPLGANCYILSDETGGGVIVDPGDMGEALLSFLEREKIQLSAILLTHGHVDHVGAVSCLKDHLNIPVMMNKKDTYLTDGKEQQVLPAGFRNLPVESRFLADVSLEDGMDFTCGTLNFHVLATPGHTPGSVCFRIEDMLFTGDTLFQGSIGRTDFPGGDIVAMEDSLNKLRELPEELSVYPGHGADTTMGEEKIHNPYLARG